jgi:hypothetical protein
MGPKAAAFSMSERRSAKRTSTRLKVWCEGDDFTLLAEATNVSKQGLFVRASSVPPPSGRFKLTIEELGTVADVEVRWTRASQESGRGGMGVQIVAFDQGARAFEEYVERQSSRSGEHRISWPPAGDGPSGGTEG